VRVPKDRRSFSLKLHRHKAKLTLLNRPAGLYELAVDGIPQSIVSVVDPRRLEYPYVRHIARVLDAAAPAGSPLRVVHLGAGALTLPRYVQVTRPGSPQIVVEFEPELYDAVVTTLPLPEGSDVRALFGDARALADAPVRRDSADSGDAQVVGAGDVTAGAPAGGAADSTRAVGWARAAGSAGATGSASAAGSAGATRSASTAGSANAADSASAAGSAGAAGSEGGAGDGSGAGSSSEWIDAEFTVVDLWDAAVIRQHVASLEFYRSVAARSLRGGIVAVNLFDGSPFDYARRQAATLRLVFENVAVVLDFDPDDPEGPLGNVLVFGSDDSLSVITHPQLLGAPHPHVLHGERLSTWIDGATPMTDADGSDSPDPDDPKWD
jgi:hypothetical protein